MSMNLFARITKIDEARREVWGRAVQEVVDKVDEIFDYDKSKPFFEEWSKEFSDATDGKSLGNIRAMHGKVAAGKAIKLDFHDTEKAIDIGTKIVDDNEWNKCLEGIYTGFSIGGSYVGDRVTEKFDGRDIKRYVAKPTEISLVDNPCIPTAKFFEVIKADGAVEKVAFKPVPVEVRGTDEDVGKFGEALNAAGMTLARAIDLVNESSMLDTTEDIEKREFSSDERKQAAKEGAALPDGSFPIKTKGDLANAIKAYGRAKNKASAKAHIIKRAKALGASDMLPSSWTKGEEKTAYPEMEKDLGLIAGALSKPLIESESDEAFSSNVASEVKAGKSQEQAVAIAYAVQRKAKNKKAAGGELKKGLWAISNFAECLSCLSNICRSAQEDFDYEGDNSPVPAKLRNAFADLVEVFKEMADEESAEMLAELKTHAEVGPDDEIEEAVEAAIRVGSLKKRLTDPELPFTEFVKIAQAELTPEEFKALKNSSVSDVTAQIIAKAGARHSKVDAAHLQEAHDHLVSMGADCPTEKLAAVAGDLAKAAQTATELEKALKRIEALEKQPVPSVLLRTMAAVPVSKSQMATGAMEQAKQDALTLLPYSKLTKFADGTIDWKSSERLLEQTGAV